MSLPPPVGCIDQDPFPLLIYSVFEKKMLKVKQITKGL
jgi:hypothetical protein